MRLQERTALVTGGTGGIGAATCARLAAEGARVAVADLDLERAADLASEIDGFGVQLDVRDIDSVAAGVAAAEAELGPISILVNNAGIAEDDFFTKTDPALWDRVIAVNLRGVLAVTHAVLGGMHERGGGSIVNVASEAGRVGSQMSTVYSATKAGVIGFTKALAKESARFHVRVNAVAPGPIDTNMLKVAPEALGELGERFVRGMVASTAMRRPGKPEEVAATIAYLASDDASFVTGETIGVSGGLGMM
jgi:2-hydroxycyclohexanecarboxyl-CoA dehydrogenase